MTFLVLLTGSVPFEEFPREMEAMRAAERGLRPNQPTLLTLRFPGLADRLWGLMESMWAHTPSDRPAVSRVEDRLTLLFPEYSQDL